jgi:hypothetical protein
VWLGSQIWWGYLGGWAPAVSWWEMVFFFSRFSYFRIVMILLMLNGNADVCFNW